MKTPRYRPANPNSPIIGRAYYVDYLENGHLRRIRDFMGRSDYDGYSDDHDLTTMRDHSGGVVNTYDYGDDGKHLLQAIKDGRGNAYLENEYAPVSPTFLDKRMLPQR